MSYWVSFCLNDESETELWSANYTSNVSEMWSEALGDTLENTIENCNQNLEILSATFKNGIFSMEENPTYFRGMNPSNGWGNYEGALQYLNDIHRMCEALKGAAGVRIHVSC